MNGKINPKFKFTNEQKNEWINKYHKKYYKEEKEMPKEEFELRKVP